MNLDYSINLGIGMKLRDDTTTCTDGDGTCRDVNEHGWNYRTTVHAGN